ncbi:unnamed protein product [Closterium sp. Naga37s-1]|nr:unnamed protein product [Closterium sp. Naga37s-1]
MRPMTSFILHLPVLTCCVLGALSVLSSSHEISENSENGPITSSLIQASSTGATGSSDASSIPLLHHSSRSLLQLRHCAAQACPPYLCCSSSFGCGLGSACLTDCLSGPCETAGNMVTSNSATGNSAAGTGNTVDGATADGSTTGGGGNPRGPRLQPPVCCTAAACDIAPIMATDGFSVDNKIGEGAFGTVYRALAIPVADLLGAMSGSRRGRNTTASGKGVEGGGVRNEELWAVKRAKRGSMGPGGAFEREVRTIWRLNHRSLVSLIGWCAEQGEQLLVYEFVPNGNLYEALHDLSRPPLSFLQRVHIALGVARALHYIHEQARDRMLHRDVKSLNILLTADLQPKLSDFGLSRMLEGGEASFFTHGNHSFGVTTLADWARRMLSHGHLADILDPRMPRQLPVLPAQLVEFADVAVSCTDPIGYRRPGMGSVCSRLEAILHSLAPTPTMPHHSPYQLTSLSATAPSSDGAASTVAAPSGEECSRIGAYSTGIQIHQGSGTSGSSASGGGAYQHTAVWSLCNHFFLS